MLDQYSYIINSSYCHDIEIPYVCDVTKLYECYHDIATSKIFLMSHHDNMLHQCIEVSRQHW